MAPGRDAPPRNLVRLVWAAGGAWVAALAWDAVVDDTDTGDPASSIGHEILSVGPIALVAVAIVVIGAIAIRRTERRSAARTASALLALSGALQLASLAWSFVRDVTTAHEGDDYVVPLLIGVVAFLAAAVWLTLLRHRRQPVPPPASARPERPSDPATSHYLAPAGEGRIARSWRLTRTAWAVVRRDRTMLGLATASMVVSAGTTAALFWATGWWDGSEPPDRLLWVPLAAAWPLTFVGTFFNVALAAAASAALEGRRLSPADALGASMRRAGQIALWSLLAAGVGVALRALSERLPLGGRIATWIVGAAWGLVTFFAVPILALEGCTAAACVKRSTRLIKDRWGEAVGGSVAITAWVVVVALPAGILLGLGIGVTGTARIVLVALGALLLVAVGAMSGAVQQVFAVALYRYATAGHVEGGFREPDLARPFTPRRRWGR